MKFVFIGMAVLVVVVIVVVVMGALTAQQHVAAVQIDLKAPPERVYEAIRDVERGTGWRTGLKKVEVVSQAGEPFRWRETADWGTITFVREVDDAPRRIVARIADEDQGFGGTWTYAITPSPRGSTLRIREDGTVASPLFRFMSKYVIGYYRSLETYAKDLSRHLQDDAQPARVAPDGV